MEGANKLEGVQKMQKYIENNINKKITMKQISDEAGYSPWHAARIFKENTGKTLFEYVRLVRLTKAAIILRDSETKILDVALEFVFDSHEGFTRAFSKEFGISPLKYSKKTPPIKLFLPQKVYDTYIALKKGETVMKEEIKRKSVFVQVIHRPERKLILKRGKDAKEYFEYSKEVGCDVWATLTSVKEALYEPIGMWLPKHLILEGTSQYVQGVEVPVEYDNSIPDGYDLIKLPPCKIMIFQGEPYDDENFMEEITAIWDHIDNFDPTVYGYKWDPEFAPRFQLIPLGYRGYIEGRPVKEIV